jgi:hypothetical protein
MGPGARRSVARRALGYLVANRHAFDPFRQGEPCSEARQTAIAELAVLVGTLRRKGHHSIRSALDELAVPLAEVFRRPEFHESFRHVPPSVPALLAVRAAVPKGLAESLVPRDALVAWLRDQGAALAERSPVRLLELRFLLERNGISPRSVPGLGLLRRPPASPFPGAARDEDLYAATHTVFFAAGFGTRRPERSLARALGVLKRRIPTFLAMQIHAGHADLVAEFLVSGSCLGVPHDAIAGAGWQMLAECQLPSGAVANSPESVPKGDAGAFRRLYHPTLVTALAGAIPEAGARRG